MNRRWSFFMIVRSEATARDLTTLTIGAALLLALLGALAFQAPAQAQTTCTPNAGAGEFWCGVVTVGEVTFGTVTTHDGFFEPQSVGSLSNEDFEIRGNSYKIGGVTVETPGRPNAGTLSFNLDVDDSDNDGVLTDEEEDILVLYIGSEEYKFSDSTSVAGVPSYYVWSSTGLDWSSETEVTLRLADLGPAAPAGFTARRATRRSSCPGRRRSRASPATSTGTRRPGTIRRPGRRLRTAGWAARTRTASR